MKIRVCEEREDNGVLEPCNIRPIANHGDPLSSMGHKLP